MSRPRSSAPARPRDTTIVVVDDDPMMLTLVERTLRGDDELLGHGIELAESQLLRKPFMPVQLLGRIRDALSV